MIKFLLYAIIVILCWPIALLIGLLWILAMLFKAVLWLLTPRPPRSAA